jgi:uncharacterized membrane protein YeaQ/YmgE (transglycosylase-associated protein family)
MSDDRTTLGEFVRDPSIARTDTGAAVVMGVTAGVVSAVVGYTIAGPLGYNGGVVVLTLAAILGAIGGVTQWQRA